MGSGSSKVISIFILVAGGTMLADMIGHSAGTTALFNGVGNLWKISINGMLGQTTSGGNSTVGA